MQGVYLAVISNDIFSVMLINADFGSVNPLNAEFPADDLLCDFQRLVGKVLDAAAGIAAHIAVMALLRCGLRFFLCAVIVAMPASVSAYFMEALTAQNFKAVLPNGVPAGILMGLYIVGASANNNLNSFGIPFGIIVECVYVHADDLNAVGQVYLRNFALTAVHGRGVEGVTYNGNKNELYFDAYKKWENICFKL